MYYPYLRARQFELIALRELALEGVRKNELYFQIFFCEGFASFRNKLDKINSGG